MLNCSNAKLLHCSIVSFLFERTSRIIVGQTEYNGAYSPYLLIRHEVSDFSLYSRKYGVVFQ